MAPSRGKGKSRATASGSSVPSSRRRSARTAQNPVPDVYNDLLAEAAVTDAVQESNRPLKRRRILREVSIPSHEPFGRDNGRRPAPKAPSDRGDETKLGINVAEPTGRWVQTLEASSDEDDEGDSAFEDVDLDQPATTGPAPASEDGIADISISLDPGTTPKRRAQARRKPASLAEKARRLLVHKAHVMCLLGHCIYVNSWCNNEVVQRNLGSLVTAKMRTYLIPKTSDSQFVRNRSFVDGLQQVCEAFKEHFQVNASAMRRPRWADETGPDGPQTDVEPMDRSDFIAAAKKMEGSQDTGNQLFCAVLRSIGLEARLVCSLQPLPFTSNSAKGSTPQKVVKPTVFAIASDTDPDKSEASADDTSVQSSRSIGKIPSVRRRLGQPSFASSPAPSPAPKAKKKAIRTLSYPVYWVEAFNAAQQKWITVDPAVTGTVNKPSKLEPPSSYELNQLSYIIAFESDGVAKDVTRRYAKAYNAKTRRQRVEATEGGAHWWKKAMRIFRRRGGALDRDQVEDAELAQKEAKEGLPGNVQDFKDHPYYALERHLRRHEVLSPRREVGKVNAGTAAKPRMEAVFRRNDVLVCRSADKWYRLGREVKAGEQPLKHVVARTFRRAKSPMEEDERDRGAKTTALYAAIQTELYVPPPVVRGRIPRNAYGNLDIYTPSMVPAGGVHIRHPLTQQAAKVMRIDSAEAVTGFQFKGRQGTAVVEGAVVAEQYADAVKAIIEGFEEEKREEASRQRSLQALRLWKRFVTGLRIAERVSAYGDGAAKGTKGKGRVDEAEEEPVGMEDAGGFRLEHAAAKAEEVPLLTAGRYSIAELSTPAKVASRKKKKVEECEDEEDLVEMEEGNEELEGRTILERPDEAYNGGDHGEGGGFIPEAEVHGDGAGGGFIYGSEDGGGGFVPEGNALEEGDGGSSGGGFISNDADGDDGFTPADADVDHGGGFIPANEEANVGDGLLPDALSTSNRRLDAGSGVRDEGEDWPRVDDVTPADGVQIRTGGHSIAELATAPEAAVKTPEREGDTYTLHDSDDTRDASAVGGHEAEHCGPDEMSRTTTAQASAQLEMKNHVVPGKEYEEGSAADEEESDRGSLLSQDPDDEDAEPDWLESD